MLALEEVRQSERGRDMTLIRNETKRKLKAGELALGFGVHHLRSSAVPMLAASCGHDWIFIDMEHGAFSMHEATQICIASLSTAMTPIVRVAADAIDEGARALDNGAMGIVVPHVDTRAQAERIARAYRYPPAGTRSWGGPPAAFRFKPPGHAEAQALLNDEILVIAMIESREAVDNADAIAAVAGIDVLLIGTSDLSADLGIAGQIGHVEVQAAYQTVAAACRTNGKVLGMGGVYDREWASRYIKESGARLVLSGNDHSYLIAGATQRTELLRSIVPGK
jgi:2-keto-3-deoxy-L-rhamnonate aldolase RhmA